MPELLTREIELRAAEADGDCIPCVIATETPVDRGTHVEILSHAPADVDLSRAPLPLLVQHDRASLNVGVIEQLRVQGGQTRGVARFGSSPLAQQILADVKAKIVRSLSVGYKLLKPVSEVGRTVRFAWQPFEASAVAVPADANAGFYRSFSKENIMPENTTELAEQQSRSQRRGGAQAVADERARVNEIHALGQMHNMSRESVQDAVEDGVTLDAFRAQVLAHVKDPGKIRTAEGAEIGLNRREIQQFSFRKAILSLMDPQFAQREGGFELAASRAVAAKLGREPQGIFVPPEVLMRRDMLVGTPTGGGNLVETELLAGSFIDVLRQQSLLMRLGGSTLSGLIGNAAIPRKTSPSNAYWVAENVAVTPSAFAVDQVTLSPHTVGGITEYSRRLLLQATPAIESLIQQDAGDTIAVELDRVGINGSGGDQPTGILGTTGIGSVAIGTNGGAITWDHILQLEEALQTAHADLSKVSYITNPKVRHALKKTSKLSTDTIGNWIWQDGTEPGFGSVNGYVAAATTHVPNTLSKGTSAGVCSALLAGNFSEFFLASWSALDILLDPYTGASAGTRRIIWLMDVDMAVRHPGAFAAILDVTTA